MMQQQHMMRPQYLVQEGSMRGLTQRAARQVVSCMLSQAIRVRGKSRH
jgi:hypothetical protein